jgi:hydroxypyruvate isomerase
VRMMLDLYHAQIGEGNLIDLVQRAGPWIGEIQVADVPGRCEPGTGEINYPAISEHLVDAGYHGTIGLEAWARGDSEIALQRFREAFTPMLPEPHAPGPAAQTDQPGSGL